MSGIKTAEIADMRLPPNPSTEYFQMEADKEIKGIELIGLDGSTNKMLLQSGRINVVDFPASIYFINIIFADHNVIKQVPKY